jgi:hypothetical protein
MTTSPLLRTATLGLLALGLATEIQAQTCRARNSTGGMRISVEQVSANGKDGGKAVNIGLGIPRGPVFELGLAGAAKSDGIDALYGIIGWELRGKDSQFAACPYYGALYTQSSESLVHAAGLQAGYEIKLAKSASLTPGAAFWYNFAESGDPYASYWAGASLNLNRFSIYAALENQVDSDSDPNLRLGISLNVGPRK